MNFRDRYGTLDRLLHDVAFRAGHAQRALADVEELLYGDRLAEIPIESPVFITSLPRSGTTILLKLLWRSGRFASHVYRDMPFVLCPMLWSRFSRPFAVDDRPRERAHGDGLEVSASSPEAFEEMIWKEFWPDHYRADRILPWRPDEEDPEFSSFLESHMRKVISLRRDGPADERRYVSKNNLNLSRVASPPAPLDRGVFLVPFREPVQQAASMLQQHRRFTRMHEEDAFVRRYMEAIGHHEFGAGLKPVDFGGWVDTAPPSDGMEFWLRYWTAAYRHALEQAGETVRLVSYARLTREPEAALGRLARAVGVSSDDLVPMSDLLRPPRTHEVERSTLPEGLVADASSLYREMQETAAV